MNFNLPPNASKEIVFAETEAYLGRLSLEIADIDNQRPWGGFFVIAPESTDLFVSTFYPEVDKETLYKHGTQISPKILLVGPGEILSWQKHDRRAEIWKAVVGPVGFKDSQDDTEPNEIQTLETGESVQHDNQVRHRLIGLGDWGVVAEIWQHTVEGQPSDEDDIVRLADNYGRN